MRSNIDTFIRHPSIANFWSIIDVCLIVCPICYHLRVMHNAFLPLSPSAVPKLRSAVQIPVNLHSQFDDDDDDDDNDDDEIVRFIYLKCAWPWRSPFWICMQIKVQFCQSNRYIVYFPICHHLRDIHSWTVQQWPRPLENASRSIESAYCTYLMAIEMFTLSVIIYETIANKIKCKKLTLKINLGSRRE